MKKRFREEYCISETVETNCVGIKNGKKMRKKTCSLKKSMKKEQKKNKNCLIKMLNLEDGICFIFQLFYLFQIYLLAQTNGKW